MDVKIPHFPGLDYLGIRDLTDFTTDILSKGNVLDIRSISNTL